MTQNDEAEARRTGNFSEEGRRTCGRDEVTKKPPHSSHAPVAKEGGTNRRPGKTANPTYNADMSETAKDRKAAGARLATVSNYDQVEAERHAMTKIADAWHHGNGGGRNRSKPPNHYTNSLPGVNIQERRRGSDDTSEQPIR
ncbi:hypothetical protein R1flu_014421 [Riccia fluitans]|uniref:Uncharacterized protein n=1 Tax=Riccia fluitans TaxID=41844 RepID=A0ABD1YGE0_9MARC